MKRITLYVEHYFHGEYDLSQLIGAKFAGLNWMEIPSSHVELEASTVERLIELSAMTEHGYTLALMELGIVPQEKDNICTIIAYEYPENMDKRVQVEALKEIAHEIFDNRGGDDDTFDYMPDTVIALADIIFKLGYGNDYQELIDLANSIEE